MKQDLIRVILMVMMLAGLIMALPPGGIATPRCLPGSVEELFTSCVAIEPR